MPEEKKGPKDKPGIIVPSPYVDKGWVEGVLEDGRFFRAELWSEPYCTLLTIYLWPATGIENATREELRNLLVANNLVEFDDEKFNSSGFSGLNLDARKSREVYGKERWSLTIIASDEDGTYIRVKVPLRMLAIIT